MNPCKMCSGNRWMVLQPMNYVAPCLECSSTRKLSDIEREADGTLQKVNGVWQMVPNPRVPQ